MLRAFEDDESVTVRTYSGRYMYGAVCLGLVSTTSAAEIMLRIAIQVEVERDLAMSPNAHTLVSMLKFFKEPCEDSMGMGRIVYFPRFSLTESELREVVEEFAHSSTHRSDS